MQTIVPEALMLTIVSILCAIFVVLINSLARVGIQEGNIINSSATKVVSDFCNYDVARLDSKLVSGSEVIRMVEQYKDVYTLKYKYVNGSYSVTDTVLDTSPFSTDRWYNITVKYDTNDKVQSITITQTNN